MLAVNVSENLHELLSKIDEHFEENLKGNFIDECARIHRRHEGHPNHKFDISSAFIPDGNINIELSNLRIAEESPCILNNFLLNLEMFNITLEVNINQLKIYGEYKESTVKPSAPTSKTGKITFILDDTIFYINVGIAIEEDSFVMLNYDINFKPANILTQINIQNKCHETSSTVIDETLLKHLSPQLKTFFYWKILHRSLGSSLVEYSASELLLDEPEEMIALSAERILKANQMMDFLLNSMNEFFKSTNQKILETPPINTCILNGEIDKSFETAKGQLQDLSTFVRCNNMSFYEHQGVQYLYGIIKLSNFRLKYSSSRIGQNSEDNGVIDVGIYRGNIFIKLALTNIENSANMSVCKVQASDLRDIDFNIYNSDNLEKYSDQLNSLVVGNLYSVIFPSLEQKISEGLLYVIQNKKT